MKLYCKKNFFLDFYFKKPEMIFKKGFCYDAIRTTISTPCTVSVRTPDCIDTFDAIKVESTDRTITFTVNPIKRLKNPYYYKDYFYTESEMRKMKLKKLNSPINKLYEQVKSSFRRKKIND